MYDVVVLIEHELSEVDVDQLLALHEGLDEPVAYHLLLPVENAAAELSASLTALGGSESLPLAATGAIDVDDLQESLDTGAAASVRRSAALFTARGSTCTAAVTHESPVDGVADVIARHDGRELVVVTAPHSVAELFHVDWASRARRRLDVPTLHLLEHEPLDESAPGHGEGISGF